jgi:energy-converting hydrogenase B subunit D
MSLLISAALLLVACSGLLIVLSRDPKRQIFALAGNGLTLALLFFVLQAPDVALSEIVINTVITPVLFLVALTAVAIDKVRS